MARALLAALALSASVSAQSPTPTPLPPSIFKCTDAAGAVSYQSRPCSGTQRQVWQRDRPREPDSPLPIPTIASVAAGGTDAAAPAEPSAPDLDDGYVVNKKVAFASYQRKRCTEAKTAMKTTLDRSHDMDQMRAIEAWIERECEVQIYATCSDATEAGVGPLTKNDPGFASHLDADGDGVACE